MKKFTKLLIAAAATILLITGVSVPGEAGIKDKVKGAAKKGTEKVKSTAGKVADKAADKAEAVGEKAADTGSKAVKGARGAAAKPAEQIGSKLQGSGEKRTSGEYVENTPLPDKADKALNKVTGKGMKKAGSAAKKVGGIIKGD